MARKITVAEMAPHIHSFLPNESKVEKLVEWLKDWINNSIQSGDIKPYDILPQKGDLACHIGVSRGTMQSVYRIIEDLGLVESKQRIGTFIKDSESLSEKLTSKRDSAIEIIKKFLNENGYKAGDKLISIRKLSKITGISGTTLSNAISSLYLAGIITKKDNHFIIASSDFSFENIEKQTLVEKLAGKIKDYIKKELNAGSKLPSNQEFARIFNVSVKTIHDAIKLLTKEGILQTRRGRYGTSVTGNNTELYHYEKIEHKIRQYILENTSVGDKLPSIKEFAKLYNISEKTIKKALNNLADDGYLTFTRGRWGGTFVMDIPQSANEAYKWLALNTEYILPE